MGFFTKAVIEALKAIPEVNARIDGTDIVYHDYYNVGVAVGTEKGLIVPVIRNADQLSVAGVEGAIRNFAVSFDRNALVMFKGNKYGFDLYQQMGLDSNHNKQLFYVDGEIDLSDRQELVDYFEANDNGVGTVSYGTFQRGISIKNLIHLLFTVPFKSEITTIQSIGRLLRLHERKDRAILWDFADDLSFNGHTNAALDYLFARVQEYAAADFEYEFHTIHL